MIHIYYNCLICFNFTYSLENKMAADDKLPINTPFGLEEGHQSDTRTVDPSWNNNDGQIDTLLGEGGGQRRGGQGFTILRCCLRDNEPWIKLKSEKAEIMLPMPSNLKSTELPSWEGEAMGKFGVAASGGMQLWDYLSEVYKNNGGNAAAAFEQAKTEFELKTANIDIEAVKKAGLSGDLQGIAMRAGIAVLPPKELRFQGISFRNFSFDWRLVPIDKQQSEEIEKAIYKLQYNSLPSASSGIVGYPHLWDISFGPGNPHHIMYIKTCACTNITVDYSGAGRSVFHDRTLWPIVVNLSLSFTEQTLHSREDVEKGIYG